MCPDRQLPSALKFVGSNLKVQTEKLNRCQNSVSKIILYCFRYAITVWYFDSDERAKAKQRFRDLTGTNASFLLCWSDGPLGP